MEMPIFTVEDPYGWLFRAEHYFDMCMRWRKGTRCRRLNVYGGSSLELVTVDQFPRPVHGMARFVGSDLEAV